MKFLLILALFSFNLHAKPVKKVDQWTLLTNLINQEIKTISSARKKTVGLQYRLLELQSEKIKLWKKKENDLFMQKSIKGIKITRQKAFQQTLIHYEQARKQGLQILKKHPRSKYAPAIYYTLALNSRDYAYDKKEFLYLQNALRLSPPKSEIAYLTKTSLAEYYYNNKKYKQAVSLYTEVTKNRNDEWLTKNLYNYGWCLLKTHKFNHAINTLEEAYNLSSGDFYIDFRDQIMDGLVNFYVLGKEIKRGKEFILSKVDNKYEALFKYLRKVSNKGYKEDAIELIKLTEAHIDPKQKDQQLGDLRLFQFDFHKQFNEKEEMYNIASVLVKIKLSPEQKEEATTKVAEEVGVQQQLIKSEFDKHDRSYKVSRLDRITNYFELLSQFDTKNHAKYLYFSAETLYTVHEFQRALTYYKNALSFQLKNASDLDLNKKAVDAIFSCIEFGNYSKVQEAIELEYAFVKHVELWPRDKKSQLILPKLFNLYLFQQRYSLSQSTIDKYIALFPKDISIQQELFKTQLDYLIKKEQVDLISTKISLMYKGYLGFSFAETKKSEKILATILFNRYQKLNLEGKKHDALAGYQSIYYKDQYPESVRADAAFNMGVIYIDLFDSTSGIKWFKRSLPLFTQEEKIKRRDYLDKVSLKSSLLQDFLNAANIQKIVLEIFCQETKTKNLKTFQDAIIYDLANDYIAKSLYTYNKSKHCAQGDFKMINDYILTHLYNHSHENDLINFSLNKEVRNQFTDKLGIYFESLYWKHHNNDITRANRYKKQLQNLNCKSCISFTKGQSQFATLDKMITKMLNKNIVFGKKFEPEQFNKLLTKRLESIKPIIDFGENILNDGHPEISIKTYDLLSSFIEKISNEIKLLTPPVNDKLFQKQFKDQMFMVGQNIYQQKAVLIERANKFINQNSILTREQTNTHYAYDVLQISDIRMPASTTVSTLDLGE